MKLKNCMEWKLLIMVKVHITYLEITATKNLSECVSLDPLNGIMTKY